MINIRRVAEFALYALIILTPFDRVLDIRIGDVSLTPTTLVSIGLVFLLIMYLIGSRQKLLLPKIALFPLLLLLIASIMDLLAIPRSAEYEEGIFEFLESGLATLIMGGSTILAYKNPMVIKKALQVLVATLMVGVLLGVVQLMGYPMWSKVGKAMKLGTIQMPFERIIGFPIDYGLFGILNVAVIPVVYISAVGRQVLYKSRSIALIILCILFAGIVVAQDRSLWLTLAVLLGVLSMSRWQGRKLTIAALLAGAVGLWSILGANHIGDLWMTLIRERYFAVQNRLAQYYTAVQVLINHPLTGIGYGYFKQVYTPPPEWKQFGVGAEMLHNFFLRKAVATGMITGISLSLIFLWAIERLRRYRVRCKNQRTRSIYLGLLCGLVGIVIELLFYPGGSSLKVVWAYVGLTIGFASAMRRRYDGQSVASAP